MEGSMHIASIVLAHDDAQALIAFSKHREKFLALLEAGVFDIESGKVEVNIHNGQVQNVHVNRMTYRRAAEPPRT
jgi:hypothetical protein